MNKHKFIILGDLHYEEKSRTAVLKAFEQLKALNPEFMISLGDLGGYSHPGTQLSFDEAKNLFSTFDFPVYPLMGNHDLEGLEFKTDVENIQAWQNTFQKKRSYYSVQKENGLFIFLSSTRFRNNPYCCHEVYIDDVQFEWLNAELKLHKDKNIFIFSHAPILGSGIRVLQNLHLRGGNAWLNHTQNPEKFIKIVFENPNIRFWSSGHNHLSQEYSDAISLKNNCLFCHTGVVSNITRDGRHQSRLIEYDQNELAVTSIDHDMNLVKPMVHYQFKSKIMKSITPLETVLNQIYTAPPPYESISFQAEIGNSQFIIAHQMVVEYLKTGKGPIGVVTDANAELTQLKVNGKVLEIWDSNILIESFHLNEMGTYSTPIGINIREHKLGQ